MLHFYKIPLAIPAKLQKQVENKFPNVIHFTGEFCFNVDIIASAFQNEDKEKLLWIISETFEPENVLENESFLSVDASKFEVLVEVGPRLTFSTAWSANCISMCQACGINGINRIELSRRYKFECSSSISEEDIHEIGGFVHDRMTECVYAAPLTSFDSAAKPEEVYTIPLLSRGQVALEELNTANGWGFDSSDVEYYTKLFTETLKRDPTNVELFDLSQSNSEHSRHWFFGGRMILNGEEQRETLFQLVKSTLTTNSNSIIAFHDNSSAIRGCEVEVMAPADVTQASPLAVQRVLLHPILTAETHNFPCGVAPFPGAETGTGGRLRDVQATGRGAHSLAGVSSYCVGGNLNIPGHKLPWEFESAAEPYPSNLASPLEILVEASNGASDYGNKYGEQVVAGFTRSFGQRSTATGERTEWLKPIMFTAGVGMMDGRHAVKGQPEVGMLVCKIGGPAYRIGMGGGSASSRVQSSSEEPSSSSAADTSLDFNAVQRGDAEMENRMNRVVRACVEMGENNPIVSIHDQGAGGNGNVLKEIVDPLGARYEVRSIPSGDPSLSVAELWGAEYQESNAILLRPTDLALVTAIGQRENCSVAQVGVVTGDGRVVLVDSSNDTEPFSLPLSLVLGKMPQKTYSFTSNPKKLLPLTFPSDITILSALERVLRLVDVGSKRFLTNKVDRSVTGLVAQQPCVGPLHTPLADVAVLAQSHFSLSGVAVAVGEQPIKGLVSHAAQARMTVGEALTNLCMARITALADVKASCNWMWAAKLDGEGANMYEACSALRDVLLLLGPGIDGGKDSLSMAATAGGEVVKAPGQVTLTCYAPVHDLTKTITPDFKQPGSHVVFVDLSGRMARLGGSALSTVFNQVGDETPDMDHPLLFKRGFEVVQQLLDERVLLSGHDRSDGGLLVTLLEMCFAGNVGMTVDLPVLPVQHTASKATNGSKTYPDNLAACFAEELGLVFEVSEEHLSLVRGAFEGADVPVSVIGTVTADKLVRVSYDGEMVLAESMTSLRDLWESTSFAIERLQCNPLCVEQEQQGLSGRAGAQYSLNFDLQCTDERILRAPADTKHQMAVIRQEGSNGDRELCAAFHTAGFTVWDVSMSDLMAGSVSLERFRGLAFCGGFSYADVNGSAKGWAGAIRFNPALLRQFEAFRDRDDTFSLGVCNGCQLMALLGWVPFPGEKVSDKSHLHYEGDGESKEARPFADRDQMRFVHNESGRFESRWTAVKILPSPSVLLSGMHGSTLGIWIAHGEGKAHFPDSTHLQTVLDRGLAPLRYADDQDEPTTSYPLNPSGSPHGIAALCSDDGRHLALMPHPERCFLSWQLPYISADLKGRLRGGTIAPWMKLFQNAREFCDKAKYE